LIAKLVRKPPFWLFVQSLALGVALAALGKFEPVRVFDTTSYEQFRFAPPAESLCQMRTFGYPLLLRLGAVLAPSHAAVPALHFVLHVLAVVVFWMGLKGVIRSDWTRLAVASSLLYSNTLLRYANALAADSLASSLAIATMGWLLLTIFGKPRRVCWWVLALGVFATYQVRPAYLFLIPLLPALALALRWLVTPRAAPRPPWRSLVLSSIAVVLIPFLAFCTVRWVTVGRFSLVSFGGNNFAGVVSVFLTADDVDRLPPDIRPLAKAVVRRRREMAATVPDYSPEITLDYMGIERPWNVNTAHVCVPAAREVYGNDWPEMDRGLWRLALAIVARKPLCYGVWLAKAFVRGVYLIASHYLMNPVYFVLLVAMAGFHAYYVVLRKRSPGDATAADPAFFVEFNALWLIAVGFALSKLLLVIVTSPPLGRFMDAAGVFFACALVRGLVYRIALCRPLMRGVAAPAAAGREGP